MVEKIKSLAQQNLEKLPVSCYSTLLTHPELIVIRAGEKGYHKLKDQNYPKRECKEQHMTMSEFADLMNAMDNVTKAQRAAMDHGSMWGWEIPAADPDMYDKDGKIIKERIKK